VPPTESPQSGHDAQSPFVAGTTQPHQEPDYELPPLGRVAIWVRHLSIIVVFPAFSLFYLWEATTVALPKRELLVSPRGFPTAIAIAMVVVSVLLAALQVFQLVKRRLAERNGSTTNEPEDDDRERITCWRDAWVTFGALIAYVAVFSYLGFAVSTLIFLAGLSSYLDPRHWIRNVIVSAIFAGAVYYLFTYLLGVQLPGGLLAGVI
jgi:putative tricarboxylic transport membrane protein